MTKELEIDVPAFPTEMATGHKIGITIRQLGTLMAMQGLLAAGAHSTLKEEIVAVLAHKYAEAALAKST